MNIAQGGEAFNPNDLTHEQQKRLIEIRRKKAELLLEIQILGAMQGVGWLLLVGFMAASIPLPTHTDQDPAIRLHHDKIHNHRTVRAARQPSFLFLLGQFFGQTISETGRAVGNITRIFNDQFTTTTPAPDATTTESDGNTTTATPITRQQLFGILGNNYRGLVRLFNTEWNSAVEQSSTNVENFRKELREAIRPYFSPNKNLTRNKS